MGITIDELAEIHPELFHMAEEGTWPSIIENGLLSTSALLDLFQVGGVERQEIEEANRRSSRQINHKKYGTALIRDQIPMTDKSLAKCLVDLELSEWYRILNSRVFFWTTRERLFRLLNAKAYRGNTNCILTIDTRKLLDEFADRVELSAINSGSTFPMNPRPRGADTFLPMAAYPYQEWRKKRSRKTAIVEVTIDYAVPNIADFVLEAVHMRDGKILETLYKK